MRHVGFIPDPTPKKLVSVNAAAGQECQPQPDAVDAGINTDANSDTEPDAATESEPDAEPDKKPAGRKSRRKTDEADA